MLMSSYIGDIQTWLFVTALRLTLSLASVSVIFDVGMFFEKRSIYSHMVVSFSKIALEDVQCCLCAIIHICLSVSTRDVRRLFSRGAKNSAV